MWSNSAYSHLSSRGFLPACIRPGRPLPTATPRPEQGLGKPPLRTRLDWTGLSISPCVPWGGTRLPPIAVVPMNGPGSPSISQALRKRSLSYCVCVFFPLFLIILKLLPNLVLGFPGLALPGPGDKYPVALSPAYHLIPHWSDPVC